MADLNAYIALLDQLRDDIADAICEMGGTATQDETMKTLVPKLLNLPDASESAIAALTTPSPSYGYYAYTEKVKLADQITVSKLYKMASMKLVISSENAVALTVTAPGWTITRTASEITLTASVADQTRSVAARLLQAVTVSHSGTGPVPATVTLTLIGRSSGKPFTATGSCQWIYSGPTWAAIEAMNLTWQQIEDRALTWDGLENLPKP